MESPSVLKILKTGDVINVIENCHKIAITPTFTFHAPKLSHELGSTKEGIYLIKKLTGHMFGMQQKFWF